MRHDLYLIGLQHHQQRMESWYARELTPRWMDRVIVWASVIIIVCVAVAR